MIPRVRLLVSVRMLATIDQTSKFRCVTLSLRTEGPELPLQLALPLVAELELVRGANLRVLVSVHSRRHQLGGHGAGALVHLLTRQAVVQDGVLDGSCATDLVLEGLLTTRLIIVSLVQDLVLIDITAFLGDALPTEDIHTDDVLLVELLGPALRDAILHLILDHGLIRTLCQSLGQRLFMQLVELVIELCDHLLDVSTFLLGVDFLEDSDLHVLL